MSYLETSDIDQDQAVVKAGNLCTATIGSPMGDDHAKLPEDALREGIRTSRALSRLEEVLAGLGGEMVIHSEEDGLVRFSVHFQTPPAAVQRIERLLSPSDLAAVVESGTIDDELHLDPQADRILQTTKQFMHAFCQGDLERCREVLRQVADQQSNRELFVEIGQLAREFHTSLSELTETLDPSFRVIVEEKLPDSGSRLEHILEITEKAANTTLDMVETMQGRNEEDVEHVRQLQNTIEALTALGPQAESRLGDATALAKKLSSSMRQTQEDLVSILMAQDFQDLTGQIIQRVLSLLRDLEAKLVNVVRVFGARGEKLEVEREALYGPAHKGKAEALQSQSDVDSLLADFGF